MKARAALTSLPGAALALTLIAFAPPPPAQAQRNFEGVVTYRMEDGDSLRYYMRDGSMRMEANIGGERQVMIMSPRERKVTMLVPLQKMYMEITIPDTDEDDPSEKVKITKLGKTEVVAGHRCEYVRVTDGTGETADICSTTELGRFMMPLGGAKRGDRAGGALQRLMEQNLFPLKMVSQQGGKGTTTMEATKIERKSLDASLFAPPAGYRKLEMPVAPGGRGAPRR